MAKASICTVEGCNNYASAKGLCADHYKRALYYGDPKQGRPVAQRSICVVEGCEGQQHVDAFCRRHLYRLRKFGSPGGGPTEAGEPERWLVAHTGWSGADCLIWPFARNDRKYGRFKTGDGRQEYAHRRMCELVNGPPPTPEHEAAHSCGRGYDGCVHPGHLRWDTKQGNASDRTLHGTEVRGEDCWNAKLTEADVRAIRKLQGLEVQRITAERFGVSRATIGDIQNRKRWAWLD